MKFTVLAHQTPSFAPVAAITVPALERYCKRHGYSFRLLTTEDRQPGGRPLGFIKTEAALRLMDGLSEEDFLFVVDLDWLVTNETVRLEYFVDWCSTLFITNDHNGINAGAYIIRGGAVGRALLQDVLRQEGAPGMSGEQDAFGKCHTFSATRFHPQQFFNSYLYTEYPETRGAEEPGHWQPGDFALHLPGRSNERRVELFSSPEIQGRIVR